MEREKLRKHLEDLLAKGLSVQLRSLPSWGASRFLRELALDKIKVKYVDGHMLPLSVPDQQEIEKSIPLTIAIDHFDELLEIADSQVFNQLRSLRDEHKYKLTFILAIKKHFDLSKFTDKLGSFFELATESVAYLPACSLEETDGVVDIIANRLGSAIGEGGKEKIYECSGGIPSLIKSCVMKSLEGKAFDEVDERIDGILIRVWEVLSDNQKQELKEAVEKGSQVTDLALLKWGVVEGNKIRSLALESYIKRQSVQKSAANLNGDRLADQLTPIEHRLYECLKAHVGGLCNRDMLVEAAWPDDNADGVSDEALDQAVSRLRKKLTGNGYEVKTMKGRGYLLQTSNR